MEHKTNPKKNPQTETNPQTNTNTNTDTERKSKIVFTACGRMDHGGCGLQLEVRKNQVTAVRADAESPLSLGHICVKAKAAVEKLNHPDRLTHPLKRVGPRGQGAFAVVSWAEALDAVAKRFSTIARQSGPERVAFCQGSPKGLEHFLLLRLANTFGSPNVCGPQHVCHMPRETAGNVTCGFMPTPDYEGDPECVLLWGSHPDATNEEGIVCTRLHRALDRGARLVVVDPKKTRLAERAQVHLPIRPGGDSALALYMLQQIITHKRYDEDFVAQWCAGYDDFVQQLFAHDERVLLARTGLSAVAVRRALELYSEAHPACLAWGNGIENTPRSFDTARALVIMMALCGNLDTRGGNIRATLPKTARLGRFVRIAKLGENVRRKLSRESGLLQRFPTVPTHQVVRSLRDGQPYRLRALYVHNSNPLVTWSDTRQVEDALRRVEFMVVSEIFMTPTAALADYVFPAATQFEFDDIGHYGLPHGFITARPRVVDPPAEAWPDLKILCALGRRLGLKADFPADWRDVLTEVIAPAGLTYPQFVARRALIAEPRYHKYRKKGFRTPSGKVELYSSELAQQGLDSVPRPWQDPGADDEGRPQDPRFPIQLTSAKSPFRFLSLGRRLSVVRKKEPVPTVLLHPQTARAYSLEDGAWVHIETRSGRITQQVHISQAMQPGVACAAVGWNEPLAGWALDDRWSWASFNRLTAQDVWGGAVGTSLLRPLWCRLEPAPAPEPPTDQPKGNAEVESDLSTSGECA
jgi:anaerobic selenocysteine-containing dehydrogenase